MLERLLVALVFALLGLLLYMVFKQRHLQRLRPPPAGRVAPAANRPAVLYFGSDDCAACPTQARYLDQLAQMWQDRLAIHKIDTVAEPEKAAAYGVFTLPTTMIVDAAGTVKQINYGLTNAQKLARQLETLRPARGEMSYEYDNAY